MNPLGVHGPLVGGARDKDSSVLLVVLIAMTSRINRVFQTLVGPGMHKIIFRCQGVHEVKEVGNHWPNKRLVK